MDGRGRDDRRRDRAASRRQTRCRPDPVRRRPGSRDLRQRVKEIRERLRLTQPAFAERFGFPTASLRDWEQGRRKSDAATTAYLAVIEHELEAVMQALEKSRAA
ncbi:helix-turn-helix domain-containing protein [Azospirillum sp. B21]|nr:helix-turn-helix domain-containing protein [Azospirillum sp. B21]